MATKKKSPGLTPRLQARLLSGSDLPTQREFTEEIIRLAGGSKALAKLVWDEFKGGGPQIKARILESVLRMMERIDKEEDHERLVEQLPDDQLEKLVTERIKQLLGDNGGAGAGPGTPE